MKFDRLSNRLAIMEPTPPDLAELEQEEQDRQLFKVWEERFYEQLGRLDCNHLIAEVKASLATVGPRPFGHDRPDDHPYWMCVGAVQDNHQDLSYRIRAAESLAWADVFEAMGLDEPEIQHWKTRAAEDLEREAKEKQTFCDICGSDLTAWSCYTGGGKKVCSSCSISRGQQHQCSTPAPATPGPDVLQF